MGGEGVQIRNLSLDEVRTVVGWAAEEGWNPGLSDAESFFASDPGGFFGAFTGGRLDGAISAVRYGREFSFVGLFIVRPELRGGALGPLLGRAALQRLENVNVGVDGVEKKIKNYEGYGFKMAHYNIRYEGQAGKAPSARTESLKLLREIPFPKLLAYDSEHFPAKREAFLKAWLGAKGHMGLACVGASGELKGYGVARPCVKGFKVGPLFAASREVAEALLSGLLKELPAETQFYLDVPATNPDALAMVSALDLKPVFRTARMYNLFRPELPEREIFGISTFELG